MKVELVKDMPAAKYYADPCEVPSLSQSMACDLALWSPAHGRLHHPKLGAEQERETAAMDRGQLFDSLILCGGMGIKVLDVPDYKSKHAQELRDLVRAAGQVPVIKAKYDAAITAVTAIREKIASFGFDLDAGDHQVSAFWPETTSEGEEIQARGRFDHLSFDWTLIGDLKTTTDARPHTLVKHMIDFGYDIQAAAYVSAIEHIHPELAGHVRMVFWFCETEPPYCVTPVECAGSMRMLGQLKWQKAIDTWARCLASGQWSDYVTEPVRVEAPAWELAKYIAA